MALAAEIFLVCVNVMTLKFDPLYERVSYPQVLEYGNYFINSSTNGI